MRATIKAAPLHAALLLLNSIDEDSLSARNLVRLIVAKRQLQDLIHTLEEGK